MITLPEDINTRYEVPMYVHGITLTYTPNIAVRYFVKSGVRMVGYFDENLIYRIEPLMEIEKKDIILESLIASSVHDNVYFLIDSGVFIPNKCEKNSILNKKIYKCLKPGDHVERLHELAEKTYLKNTPDYGEFGSKFHSVEAPVFIGGKKYFDYIKISVNCASTVTKEDIVKNKKELDNWVLQKLQNHRSFLKYKTPITLLEVSNIVLTRDKRVEYTFSLKKELVELLNEQGD